MTKFERYIDSPYLYFTRDLRTIAEICDMSPDEVNRFRDWSPAKLREVINDLRQYVDETSAKYVREMGNDWLEAVFLNDGQVSKSRWRSYQAISH